MNCYRGHNIYALVVTVVFITCHNNLFIRVNAINFVHNPTQEIESKLVPDDIYWDIYPPSHNQISL